jgi:hypothetical protein
MTGFEIKTDTAQPRKMSRMNRGLIWVAAGAVLVIGTCAGFIALMPNPNGVKWQIQDLPEFRTKVGETLEFPIKTTPFPAEDGPMMFKVALQEGAPPMEGLDIDEKSGIVSFTPTRPGRVSFLVAAATTHHMKMSIRTVFVQVDPVEEGPEK